MRRVRTHTNPLNIIHRFKDVNLPQNQELDIEIGFGKGDFLMNWAKNNPDHYVVGIEVRKQMVVLLEEDLKKDTLNNIAIYHGNGQVFLEDVPLDNSIDRLFIFHPDPWFKSKHHKRRVITPAFLTLAHQKLKCNGKLYISTDVKLLFDDITDLLESMPAFEPIRDAFWETAYQTHWSKFSKKDNRHSFVQTYIKNKK